MQLRLYEIVLVRELWIRRIWSTCIFLPRNLSVMPFLYWGIHILCICCADLFHQKSHIYPSFPWKSDFFFRFDTLCWKMKFCFWVHWGVGTFIIIVYLSIYCTNKINKEIDQKENRALILIPCLTLKMLVRKIL